jgi:hypothetical protein
VASAAALPLSGVGSTPTPHERLCVGRFPLGADFRSPIPDSAPTRAAFQGACVNGVVSCSKNSNLMAQLANQSRKTSAILPIPLIRLGPAPSSTTPMRLGRWCRRPARAFTAARKVIDQIVRYDAYRPTVGWKRLVQFSEFGPENMGVPHFFSKSLQKNAKEDLADGGLELACARDWVSVFKIEKIRMSAAVGVTYPLPKAPTKCGGHLAVRLPTRHTSASCCSVPYGLLSEPCRAMISQLSVWNDCRRGKRRAS